MHMLHLLHRSFTIKLRTARNQQHQILTLANEAHRQHSIQINLEVKRAYHSGSSNVDWSLSNCI